VAGAERKRYHLVGVAGVGMSALAGALLDAGHAVSGSDRHLDAGHSLEVLRKLKSSGVELHGQNGLGVRSDTDAVVVSTAIEDDNPDLAAARRLAVPVRHRADVLGDLLVGRYSVAISGTSGKSTVTGMLGWICDRAGRDPAVINGAPVLNWKTEERIGNVRAGDGSLCIIEADESDRSLLGLHPDWCVITNASRDHFDLSETLALFECFKSQARQGVVDMLEERELLESIEVEGSRSGVRFKYGDLVCELPVLGTHNAQNAVVAIRVAEALGIKAVDACAALREFAGIERRLERVGGVGPVDVFDDYGHNPAKIEAAFDTLSPLYDSLQVVWRPHGYGPLRMMMDDLVSLFSRRCRPEDRLWILPVYDAGGTADRTVSSEALIAALEPSGIAVQWVEDCGVAEAAVLASLGNAATQAVVTMGARDPELPLLARSIVKALGASGSVAT